MEKQVKFSEKRRAILDVFRNREHPSAEWIYHTLKPDYPRLSIGTVYRNLQRFKEEGKVRPLAVVDGQERFDGNISEHAHFICDQCSAIFDLDILLPDDVGAFVKQDGFQVTVRQLFLRGKCPECAAKEDGI